MTQTALDKGGNEGGRATQVGGGRVYEVCRGELTALRNACSLS